MIAKKSGNWNKNAGCDTHSILCSLLIPFPVLLFLTLNLLAIETIPNKKHRVNSVCSIGINSRDANKKRHFIMQML